MRDHNFAFYLALVRIDIPSWGGEIRKIGMLCRFDERGWRNSEMLFERFGKIEFIVVTDQVRTLVYRAPTREKSMSVLHAYFDDILLDTDVVVLLERAGQMTAFKTETFCQPGNGQGKHVIVLNVALDLVEHVAALAFRRFAEQKIGEFEKDGNVYFGGKNVVFDQFRESDIHAGRRVVNRWLLVKNGGGFAIESDPNVFPWVLEICCVGGQFVGTNDKQLSGMHGMLPVSIFESAAAVKAEVDQIMLADKGAETVTAWTRLMPDEQRDETARRSDARQNDLRH